VEPPTPVVPDEDSSERRRGEDTRGIPSNEVLDEAMEARLMDMAGFDRNDLYERRGPVTRRGLAHLLEPDDAILAVERDHAVIRRKDGSVQTFWNLRRDPSWIRRIGGGSGDAERAEGDGSGELAPPESG